jgi:protein-S-isoprenylcysteine O-methyltransferase Ste14
MFLFSANLFIGLLAIIGIIPLHILVLKEEKHLETQHGESYRRYKNSVRRYWLF